MRKILTILAFCLLTMSATCQTTTHSAVLSWQPSTTPSVTYNVLRASSQAGPFTSIKTGLSVLTYTDANLTANTQVCYEVTASAAGMADSDPSNIVCGTTGQDQVAVPGTLTITIK